MFSTGKQKKRKEKGHGNGSLGPEVFYVGGFFWSFHLFSGRRRIDKKCKGGKRLKDW